MEKSLKEIIDGPSYFERKIFCERFLRKNIMIDMTSKILNDSEKKICH